TQLPSIFFDHGQRRGLLCHRSQVTWCTLYKERGGRCESFYEFTHITDIVGRSYGVLPRQCCRMTCVVDDGTFYCSVLRVIYSPNKQCVVRNPEGIVAGQVSILLVYRQIPICREVAFACIPSHDTRGDIGDTLLDYR